MPTTLLPIARLRAAPPGRLIGHNPAPDVRSRSPGEKA